MRQSDIGLNTRAWLALVVVAGVMCALLFGAAGTTQYWQAWVYVAIFLGASILTTLYLMKRDPALLARRMRGGPMFEKEGTQRIIMVFISSDSSLSWWCPHSTIASRGPLFPCGASSSVISSWRSASISFF